MVLFTSWETFAQQALSMLQTSHGEARLLVKYRHKEGLLVVKVTNGSQTIKFKTGDKDDVRFIEKLQQSFLMEGIDPAKAVGSAEHAASGAGQGSGASAASGRGAAGRTAGQSGAAARSERVSGAQKRKARRQALKSGAALTAREQQKALKKAAQRSRKRTRREEKRMLQAAGAGSAFPALVPAVPGR